VHEQTARHGYYMERMFAAIMKISRVATLQKLRWAEVLWTASTARGSGVSKEIHVVAKFLHCVRDTGGGIAPA